MRPAWLALIYGSAAAWGRIIRPVRCNLLSERSTPIPAPAVVFPSQDWDGDDGPWSTFTLRIGHPAQNVRVLPSTASEQTWVVLPQGCASSYGPDCANARGWLFENSTSKTWRNRGYYDLDIEQNLGMGGTGDFGKDTIGIGAQGTGGPTIDNQLVAGIAVDAYYLGIFGINPKTTNLSTFDRPIPSFMSNLKKNGFIPSLSFGYTADAPYRLKKVTGSLTLGGFDQSRLTPNPVSFSFADDNRRDLVVGIQSITWSSSTSTSSNNKGALLPEPILAYIDSTIPYFYLPIEACQAFESAFGLVYDNTASLYLVNDTLHSNLLLQNPNITFTIGNGLSGGPSTSIILPYASFDLTATFPLVQNTSRYFPLKRAQNDTQYTIGRTFLQEAYLTVDWERANFSISQALFQEDSPPQQIVTITAVNSTLSSNTMDGTSSHSLGTGVIAGTSVAIVIVALACFSGIIIYILRRRRIKEALPTKTNSENSLDPQGSGFLKAELATNIDSRPPPGTRLQEIGVGGTSGSTVAIEIGTKHENVASELQPGVPLNEELAFATRSWAKELPTPIPAEELSSAGPLSPLSSVYEMPGDEGSWPELGDTSEGSRRGIGMTTDAEKGNLSVIDNKKGPRDKRLSVRVAKSFEDFRKALSREDPERDHTLGDKEKQSPASSL